MFSLSLEDGSKSKETSTNQENKETQVTAMG